LGKSLPSSNRTYVTDANIISWLAPGFSAWCQVVQIRCQIEWPVCCIPQNSIGGDSNSSSSPANPKMRSWSSSCCFPICRQNRQKCRRSGFNEITVHDSNWIEVENAIKRQIEPEEDWKDKRNTIFFSYCFFPFRGSRFIVKTSSFSRSFSDLYCAL
jgi:hypothetical protein